MISNGSKDFIIKANVVEEYVGNYEGTIEIPEGVIRIAMGAFPPTWVRDYSKVTKIVFPRSLKCIPSGVCSMWNNLKEVVIPEGVTTISETAFFETAIEEIVIPSTVERIGTRAFSLCKNLKKITLNHVSTAILNRVMCADYSSVSSYEVRRANMLPALPFKIYIGSSPELELSQFFKYCDLEDEKTKFSIKDWFVFYGDYLVGYLGKETELKLPENTKGIAYEAFANNKSIRSVVMSEKVKWIAQEAFAGCSSLHTVKLNAAMEQIGDQAFINSGIREIRIPYKVKYVGERAFDNCRLLNKLIIEDKLSSRSYWRTEGWHRWWQSGLLVQPDYDYI